LYHPTIGWRVIKKKPRISSALPGKEFRVRVRV
jgi:hypothetical protein